MLLLLLLLLLLTLLLLSLPSFELPPPLLLLLSPSSPVPGSTDVTPSSRSFTGRDLPSPWGGRATGALLSLSCRCGMRFTTPLVCKTCCTYVTSGTCMIINFHSYVVTGRATPGDAHLGLWHAYGYDE
jgi:hypothetical protein